MGGADVKWSCQVELGVGGSASQVTYWRCQKPHRWRNAARGHQPETYSDDLPLSSAEIILGYVRKEGSRSVSPRLAPKTRARTLIGSERRLDSNSVCFW